MKILVLIEWSYKVPPIMLTIDARMVMRFDHVVQLRLDTCIGSVCESTHTHIPLKYKCMIEMSNRIKHVFLKW